MVTPQSLAYFDPVLCSDSLEFYPFGESQSHLQQRFLIGTYELLKTEDGKEPTDGDKRIGRIYVCDAIDNNDSDLMQIVERQRIETSAVFDIKWSYNRVDSKELVGVACADGELSIYQANSSSDASDFLTPVCSTSGPTSQSSMCCSLDWSNRLSVSNEPQITASQSDGTVRLMQLAQTQLETVSQWQAHDAEAWITSFDYWNPSVVFSGGDDSRFKGWDTRMNPDDSAPLFNLRKHQAGVCSIHSNFHRQYMVATGGYDDTVMVWDTRSMRRPLAESNIGGGIWRLKWHPLEPTQLLVGAMYNGFHILDVSVDGLEPASTAPLPEGGASVTIDTQTSFMEHKSIAYGADWCQTRVDASRGWLVGTCSFYDHAVHLWRRP
ncbi:hypothetical protein LPJ73_005510 [Coemansia sp. RSA 2703]|nr:hypothetical protein LPJ73_005510 [Coemansia sp. RSA 2703]